MVQSRDRPLPAGTPWRRRHRSLSLKTGGEKQGRCYRVVNGDLVEIAGGLRAGEAYVLRAASPEGWRPGGRGRAAAGRK